MLDGKDLQAIKAIMKEELSERLDETEVGMEEKLGRRTILILDEIERTRGILEERMVRTEKNVEELKKSAEADRIQNGTLDVILQLYQKQQEEIDELKTKIV